MPTATQRMQAVPLVGGPLAFAGAVSLEVSAQGVRPWRLPFDRLDLFEPGLQERALCPAGVRLTLVSDTDNLTLEVEPIAPAEANQGTHWCFDLFVDGALHTRALPARDQGVVRFTDLPDGEHTLEVWLPHLCPVRVGRVLIDDPATARPWHDPRPRWTVYGSSITQCTATPPSETWPARVARRFDLHLTCLGFAGECCLEPRVAMMIRDLPADYIGLCLGINVLHSYSSRTFRPAVLGVIETIREKHPWTPMACVSPIFSPPREEAVTPVGMNLRIMRTQIADAVAKLRAHGDANLHYVDGLELFGPDCLKHLPDALHPDAAGYARLAERYARIVMPRLGARFQ